MDEIVASEVHQVVELISAVYLPDGVVHLFGQGQVRMVKHAEAMRRDEELDGNPAAGMTLDQFRSALGR
jgi:hypothetical protein